MQFLPWFLHANSSTKIIENAPKNEIRSSLGFVFPKAGQFPSKAMSVNVVDGMLTFQGEKASGCSGLNSIIVEVLQHLGVEPKIGVVLPPKSSICS